MGMLDGKVAVITGAARGIGRAVAERLLEHGAYIVACDLDETPLQELQATAKNRRVVPMAGNITEPGVPDRIMDLTAQTFGRLDILVNNAGYTWDGMLHKMTDEQFQAMLDIHLVAPFRLIRAAAPLMRDAAKKEQESGTVSRRKIVNVTSISGLMGNPGQANYSAAKAGVVGLTKTVAREWGPFGINCNAVAFGLIDTRLTQDKGRGETVLGKSVGIPGQMRAMMEQMIPLGHVGQPDEAAAAVFYLCSPLADYVNGDILKVDGGFYA